MTTDIVKLLESYVSEAPHCSYFYAPGHPAPSDCVTCCRLAMLRSDAQAALDAVPVLEWKDCENPEYSSIAQINSHFQAIACANGWWEIRASFVPESIAYSQASSKTVDGAKTEVAARLREMGVLFRTVKP